MAIVARFKLCDEDRDRFGGPEWVTFDERDLDRQTQFVLMEFEKAFDIPLNYFMRIDRPLGLMRWRAGAIWMARKMAGIETPKWHDFAIMPRLAVEELLPDSEPDAGPPSSADSTEAAESKTVSG